MGFKKSKERYLMGTSQIHDDMAMLNTPCGGFANEDYSQPAQQPECSIPEDLLWEDSHTAPTTDSISIIDAYHILTDVVYELPRLHEGNRSPQASFPESVGSSTGDEVNNLLTITQENQNIDFESEAPSNEETPPNPPDKCKRIRKPIEYPICGQVLTKSGIKYHMDTHNNTQKHKCKYCEKAYGYTQRLLDHIEAFHSGKIYQW